MKVKIDFDYEELATLDSEEGGEIVALAHHLLDVAIENRNDNVKCSVTVDSNKD